MKTCFCLAVFCLAVLCAASCSTPQLPAPTTIEEFATAYEKAKSEQEKLLLCIDAINRKLIRRGGPVSDIDAIFGTDYAASIPAQPAKEQPLEEGVVDFGKPPFEVGVVHFGEPPPTPPSPYHSVDYRGWYLAFEFSSNGTIFKYYLSDLHK